MAELSALDDLLDGSMPVAAAVATGDGPIRARSASVREDARFQAASISKPVGAVAVLSLVADGVLGLDDDIAPLLRSWTLPPVGPWQPVVTLRNLLSHAAGLTVHGFPGYPRTQTPPTLVEILEGKGNTPAVVVDLVPGLQPRYSGGGYVLLQVLVEDMTGRSFVELAMERVLRPAGMTSSGYDDPPVMAPAMLQDGSPVPDGPHRYAELVGGLWTTPGDLVRFARAVQQRRLLPEFLHDELLREQLPTWGLGFGLLPGEAFGHGGANAGYRCRMIAALDGSWSGAVMTGSDAGGADCVRILNRIGESEPWPGWVTLPEPPSDEQLLAGALGDYVDDGGRTWTLDGDVQRGLWLTVSPHPPLLLQVVAVDRCKLPGLDAELLLEWVDGRVTRLDLRQNGLTTGATRAQA